MTEKGREAITKAFGNKLRIRVCGICLKGDAVLLVNHRGINEENEFWSLPGGGMDFGSSAEENLIREFQEETGLDIEIVEFLCVNEFIGSPLHAVELFFLVRQVGGKLTKGIEPELIEEADIIKAVEFLKWSEINQKENSKLHNLFHQSKNQDELLRRTGYILQKKNK